MALSGRHMALKLLSVAMAMLLCIAPLWAAGKKTSKPVAPPDAGLFDKAQQIPALLKAGRITPDQIPNPHWREGACSACHRGTPSAKDKALLDKDINQLCQNCHESISATTYGHAVGMKPSAEIGKRMPDRFRQAVQRGGDIVTCITCHDLPMQCLKERYTEKEHNPRFFLEGPYYTRTELCFKCHNPKYYEKFNPHDQISDEGELNKQVCLMCHEVTPNRHNVKSIDDVKFTVKDDLTDLCTGCHEWIPHPRKPIWKREEGPNHLIKPKEEVLEWMKKAERSDDLILPLEPESGRIFCATCHNPHERGVQFENKADRGADNLYRLRRKGNNVICMSCHDM